jgi:hypothetical protein
LAKPPIVRENAPLGVLPPPEALELFSNFGSETSMEAMRLWGFTHQRSYRYATLALAIGGTRALGLIGGFIYLVMQGHGAYAATLLDAVAGGRLPRHPPVAR